MPATHLRTRLPQMFPAEQPLLVERMRTAFLMPDLLDPTTSETTDPWPGGDPAEADVREACRSDSRLFCETFFPEVCRQPFNALHLAMFALRDQRIQDNVRGWRDVTAAPRGSGKTSIKQILVVHDCLYRIEKYIGVGSANFDHARDKVKSIRDIFTENAELVRVYGEQDTGTPSHPGRWTEHDFITRTGVRVRAFTPKMKTRGFLWNGSRLTKALFDDVEDQELVLTPLRRERLLTWLQSDIAKLGEHDLCMDGIGTVLHPESMLATLLKNPGFRAETYRAVVRFADGDEAVALWSQWRDIVLDLDNPARLEDAHAFYLAHEAAMLEGSEVLWPEAQSYEYLMLDRIIFGETAFWTERQNAPMQDSRFIFNMDTALWFARREDALIRSDGKLVHLLDMTNLAGYWDPTPDRSQTSGDFTCFTVGMKDKYGYIYLVDAYCAQEPSTDVALDAIVDLIWYYRIPLIGLEINGFASLLTNELRRKIDEKAQREQQPWAVSFVPIKNMRNKILRIKTLDPLVANGWLAFDEHLPPALVQQFRDFIPIEGMNKFDDGPDSAEGLCRVLGGLFDRRAAF